MCFIRGGSLRLFGGGVVFEGLSLLFWIVFVCSMSGSEALMCCLMCNARAVSRVTRHTSHVTHHTSHVTRHTSPRYYVLHLQRGAEGLRVRRRQEEELEQRLRRGEVRGGTSASQRVWGSVLGFDL